MASAADLVEFLGPGTTYGTVLVRAAAVAQDPSQLGFSSKSVPDDRSGEFSLEVADDGVQVAVLSDDGVNVQVTDLGDIDDPLGSEPQNLPGLTNLGTGQDLPTLGQSLKLIPGTLSANHRYKFEWQYRNTIHTGDSDIDGMKVFVFGGNAQLALAKPVITLSPLDPTEETPSEWDGLLFPPQGAKVFLGSIVNIGVQIYEYDTMEMGGSKVEIPFGGDTATATLTVENATFEDGKNTATMTLQRVYGGLYTKQAVKPLVRVKIPETWSGDVKVSCLVVDPGNDPASVTLLKESKMYEFKGKLADKDLKLSATWSMVPADAKLPETVTGVSGKYRPILPFYNDILQEYKPFDLWDKQTARDMRNVYKYGPDLTIDNSANYYGIPVQEKFDKYTTSHKSMDVSIIRSDIMALYPGPGWKFDEIYNKWESDSGYSTFSIGIQDVGVDCTEDTYKSPNSENIALDFLKEMPGLGDDVSVSRVQRYYCKGKEIEGDMPVEVISLYEPFDNNGGATLKQQVKPQ